MGLLLVRLLGWFYIQYLCSCFTHYFKCIMHKQEWHKVYIF